MADKRFVEKLRAAIEADARRPTRDRWNDLVRRGAIDANGKVLVRGPEVSPPPTAGKGGKAKRGK